MSRSSECPIDFPTARDDPFDPPPEFTRLREGPPVRACLPDGSAHWLISRHADARAALADPRLSADDQHPNFPRVIALPPVPGALSFLRMDEPEHGRLRRMLTPQFTLRRVNAMRPGIERAVDELLTDMEAGGPPADLVDDFALPLPSLVICQLLGVPYADHAFFQEHSRVMVSTTAPPEEGHRALRAMSDYLGGLIEDKRKDPGDDLLSRVATEWIDSGRLTRDELVAMARLLLVAGHETTANMLGLSVLLLWDRPEQLAALRDDAELVRPAVDELLRYLSVVQIGIARVATADLTIGGVDIAADEGVLVSLPAANRDAAQFPDGDELNLARSARQHVAFGYGVHQCIGQPLARVELEIALSGLLARFPGLKPACDRSELVFRDDVVVYGVEALPVSW